jgi:hypothetical protein
MNTIRKVLVGVIVLALTLGCAFGVAGSTIAGEGAGMEITRPVLDDAGNILRAGPSGSGGSYD